MIQVPCCKQRRLQRRHLVPIIGEKQQQQQRSVRFRWEGGDNISWFALFWELFCLYYSLKLHTQRCNQKTQRRCLRTAFKRASDILVSSLFPPWRCSWSRGGCRIPKLFRHLLARQCRHSTIQPFHFFTLHVSAVSLCTGSSLWGEFLRREGTPPGLKPTVALSSSQYAEAFSNKLEFSLMRQFYP